jgi:hypothetical protein
MAEVAFATSGGLEVFRRGVKLRVWESLDRFRRGGRGGGDPSGDGDVDLDVLFPDPAISCNTVAEHWGKYVAIGDHRRKLLAGGSSDMCPGNASWKRY